MVVNVGWATGQPALFSHAAVYAEGDHMATGNYVPADEEVPFGVDPRNVQRRANTRCFYTYIFDTFTDISLYEGQWALDEYMSGIAGFNSRSVPRRAYLSGQDVRFRSRFWMQTPMFVRKAPQSDSSVGSDHLHPWVIEAERQSKGYRGNLDRPRVWVRDGVDTVPISERGAGTLQRGDVLAVSFTVTYHITSSYWFPQFHPADLVVLKSGDGDVPDYSAPGIDLYKRPPPSFGGVDGLDGDKEDPPEGSASQPEGERREDSAPMEDVVEASLKVNIGGGEDSVERMEVDESGVLVGRGSSDTLGSVGDGETGVGEGFELLGSAEGNGQEEDEEFMDIAAQEEAVQLRKVGSGRAGRSGRKRV
uniref:N/A n=1 Tax=Ganoderma boninense TaxID=34458 RepID=A0A5K1JUV9_9APHY|nr:N/A [Ganoderma boninense]